MSNGCALAIKKGTEQEFNHITAKLIECNIKNEHSSSSAAESAPDCEKTEEDKREAKKREKTAFLLNQTVTICQNQQLLQKKLNLLKKQISLYSDMMAASSAPVIYKMPMLASEAPDAL